MTTKLVTHPLKTGKLTAMSNVTSITVTGHQVSILEDEPEPGKKDRSAVHLTFYGERGSELRSISNRRGDVEHPQKLPSLLATAEELGLIMDRDDAVEIGLSLLAMAMEDKTAAEIEAVQTRLAKAIAELHSQVT
ncbi:MAG: hypothetical protein QNJ53_12540 [Pleurocapsa sp. MO_192.B19]|nr:hypothetical protein [Pleurocapsa sp. MO_192.B19]